MPDGDPCTQDSECLNGNCPPDDLICCDAACTGECESCDGAKTGAGDGNCAPVTAGTDPDDECLAASRCDHCNGAATPACEAGTCDTCTTMYQGNAGVLQICGDTVPRCQLRVNTQTYNCQEICRAGGGDCVSYYNDNPNNTCTPNVTVELGCTSSTTNGSAMCICTHYCGVHPPCPDGFTCDGTDCV
jgi:hypothetical protein